MNDTFVTVVSVQQVLKQEAYILLYTQFAAEVPTTDTPKIHAPALSHTNTTLKSKDYQDVSLKASVKAVVVATVDVVPIISTEMEEDFSEGDEPKMCRLPRRSSFTTSCCRYVSIKTRLSYQYFYWCFNLFR